MLRPVMHRLRDYFNAPILLNLQQYLAMSKETDRILLALLKSGSIDRSETIPFWEAVAIGNERILASHPLLPFIYLDAQDVLITPRVIVKSYEPGVHLALSRLIKPGFTIIEAGARQGFHTLTMAYLTVPGGGRVFAFEPDPRSFSILKDNIEAHRMREIVNIYPMAVCAGDLLKDLHLRIDFIRMDMEGFEFAALDGMWEYLTSPEIRVMFKFAPRLHRANQDRSLEESLARLRGIGMKFWRIADDGLLLPTEVEEMLKMPDNTRCDFVAARELE